MKPSLRGFRSAARLIISSADGMRGRDAHTNRTAILVANRVNTHAIEAYPIVSLGCNNW